jgi:CMP/dCMP kinase
MRIAIDGPAASGKSSLGRALADAFGLRFVETGKMYRAVAYALHHGMPLSEVRIDVEPHGRFLLNGEDVTERLHTQEMDHASSKAATIPEVRTRMVELQRAIAAPGGVVMEGRDIGTVVLPDADVKIFLQASTRERAIRRIRQRGSGVLAEVMREIALRDRRDSMRSISPLKAATNATIIDTDQKPLSEVISAAQNLVRDRLDDVGRATENLG